MPDLHAFFCTQIVLLEIQKTGFFFFLDGSREVESTLLALIKVAIWRRVPHPPGMLHTLSQKQFGKYFSAEIFPASMGIVPVLFKKIFIQQHPRKKYL
jgi:hypothetical protein